MQNDVTFPDDIAALKALLVASDAALVQSQKAVAELTQALSSRELQIEALQLQIMAVKQRARLSSLGVETASNSFHLGM